MRLGEIARVARGVVTGDAAHFIVSRAEAKRLGIESFTRPVLRSARETAKDRPAVVYDAPDREVIIIAAKRDIDQNPKLKEYLGEMRPRVANVRPSPIAVTYVGVPRFVANPDGLIVTNALFTVTPRKNMTSEDIVALVQRLNDAVSRFDSSGKGKRRSPREIEDIEI